MSETHLLPEDNKPVAIGRRRRGSGFGDRDRGRVESE
jgi:hypothetical protein